MVMPSQGIEPENPEVYVRGTLDSLMLNVAKTYMKSALKSEIACCYFRYGDQIPRSIIGRLFGIAWILTGVTLIAVFTASITSAITVVSVKGSCTDMQGQHVLSLIHI